MKMSSSMNHNTTTNWLYAYEFVEDISVVSAAADFALLPPPRPAAIAAFDFTRASGAITCSSNVSSELDCYFEDSEGFKEACPRKRLKSESCTASGSKACREKLRRDRLNERFLELGSILEPDSPPKTDKAAIICDAVRMVTQLRSEAQQLNESNQDLLEKIKELKAEKNELRDEKQRLKTDKEKLEQQIKALTGQPGFLAHHSATGVAFAAQEKDAGNKLMPFIGYPGVAMWQFMQPAIVDTSQDHVLRPPVA